MTQSSPLRILVVEDNPVNQKVACGLLQRQGHTVVVAVNGKEALQTLRDQVFDLVLMDVQMPEMDGIQTTAAIRAGEEGTGRRLPIIALTAQAFQEDRERCLAAGMDGYLAKPVHPQQLLQTVTKVTARTVNET
jgi:CheY-like chemotaxis protein